MEKRFRKHQIAVAREMIKVYHDAHPPRPGEPFNPVVFVEQSPLFFVEDGHDVSFFALSRNPNLTAEFINRNIDEDWKFTFLSSVAPWEVIRDNPNKDWFYSEVSCNPSITIDVMRAKLDDPFWEPCYFSSNPHVTWETVQANPDFPWDLNHLVYNPNITRDIVEANPEFFLDVPSPKPKPPPTSFWGFLWRIRDISMHMEWWKHLDVTSGPRWFFRQFIDGVAWVLSKNPSVDWTFVRAFPCENWNIVTLADNPMHVARDRWVTIAKSTALAICLVCARLGLPGEIAREVFSFVQIELW